MTEAPSVLATIAPLNIEGCAADDTHGPAPQLNWLPIKDLRVNSAYQREISVAGRRNIVQIARAFRWHHFAPVIVSPIAGGLYAIIDGQHRVTAAASVGHITVPCQIVLASAEDQAAAFRAVNGNVTQVSPLALHKAAIAAGDETALRIARVTRAAGVTVLAYPKPELKQAPGETMAIVALREVIDQHPQDLVILALSMLATGQNAVAGGVSASMIKAVTEFVVWVSKSGASRAAISAFFAETLIIREADKARLVERKKGVAVWSLLLLRLQNRWQDRKGAAA